jgi:hypothetical protein
MDRVAAETLADAVHREDPPSGDGIGQSRVELAGGPVAIALRRVQRSG